MNADTPLLKAMGMTSEAHTHSFTPPDEFWASGEITGSGDEFAPFAALKEGDRVTYEGRPMIVESTRPTLNGISIVLRPDEDPVISTEDRP